MNRYFKYRLIAGYCLLACGLVADPIPTLTATTGTASIDELGGMLAASGDSFALSVSCTRCGPNRVGFYVGLYTVSFAIFVPSPLNQPGEQGSGQLTLGGVPYPVESVGSGMVIGPGVNLLPVGNPLNGIFSVSSGNITAPPIAPGSGSSTIDLPAVMEGSFSACAPTPSGQCGSSSPTVADVSLNLPGTLNFTISVFYTGTLPDYVDISESFVSTPVPEPASIILVALGLALAVGLRRRCRNPFTPEPRHKFAIHC